MIELFTDYRSQLDLLPVKKSSELPGAFCPVRVSVSSLALPPQHDAPSRRVPYPHGLS